MTSSRWAGEPSATRRRPSAEERFWKYVEKTDDCWLWRGGTANGYGKFLVSWKNRERKQIRAHRWAYQSIVGPIPDGLVLDHTCGIKLCVNPAHLEAVTQRENTLRSPIGSPQVNARKTECKYGHPFSGENLRIHFVRGLQRRSCVICRRAVSRRAKAARKERSA